MRLNSCDCFEALCECNIFFLLGCSWFKIFGSLIVTMSLSWCAIFFELHSNDFVSIHVFGKLFALELPRLIFVFDTHCGLLDWLD